MAPLGPGLVGPMAQAQAQGRLPPQLPRLGADQRIYVSACIERPITLFIPALPARAASAWG